MSTLSNFDSTVNSFYLAFYGRPADPAGLKFWSQQLAASNGELGAITQAFATSEEAQVRFGADSLGERIGEIYQQLFNRTMDADGLAYWTGVVEQGNASLADVSIAILNGARGSDATLSALRQKAADDFTAQVEATGAEYSGYASIEAARILVRAVTPNATEADVAQLVKSAVSFADTATKTPAVVEAIAVNTTLLALFDTTRGKGDPVALAQALADTAKAAAGDPVTLESLLRGGGMDKVLKVMPAAATLKDVVKALADGGLPAAVEVVYPTAPTAPSNPGTPSSSAFKLAFDHVIESDLDAHKKDNVTNYSQSDVTFKYTGNDLAKGQYVQASIDGGDHWTQLMVETDTVSKTVTVLGVKLAGQKTHIESFASPNISIQEIAPQNVTTTITLRVVDADGKPVASFTPFKQDIVYDGYVAMPSLNFSVGESKNAFELATSEAFATSKAVYDIGTTEEGAYVEYDTSLPLTNNGANMFVNPSSNWSKDKPVLKEGEITTFDVRQVDVAGNISFTQTVNVVLDTVKPQGTPVITLAEAISGTIPPSIDDDSVNDSDIFPVGFGPVTSTPVTTSPNTVNLTISGLEKSTNVGWEYSTDKGVSWTFGGRNTESGTAPLSLEKLTTGPIEVLVRQLDAAGNVSPQSAPYTIEGAEAEPTFIIGYGNNTLFIAGTSTDPVLVDLTADTYARADEAPKSYSTNKFTMANAADYAGEVIVSGTVAEIAVAAPSFNVNKIAAYGIVDAKASIFTGAPGERSFISADIQNLIDGAGSVKLTDTLSMQEWKLLDDLADFDMATLDATVDPIASPDVPPETTTPDIPPETTTPEPPGSNLPFKVVATADGVRIESTVAGSLRLSGDGSAGVKTLDPSGKIIVGETDVGAQPEVLSGTIVLVPTGALPLRDDSGIVYTLGTVADNVIDNVDYAWGFDGADQIMGTAGNNRLYGGAGDDTLRGMEGDDYLDGGAGSDILFGGAGKNTIVGGLGGDTIIGFGDDTLVYKAGAESNAGNLHEKSNPVKSADIVHAVGAQKLTFDFGFEVSNLATGIMPTNQADSPEAMFALLTQAYQDSGALDSDVAVLSTASSTQKLLLVDNGDGKIDADDIAVVLIGSGYFSLDSNGDVNYYNLPI